MTRRSRDEISLRRDALVARAALQRIQVAATVDRAREVSMVRKGVGAMAWQLARSFATARSGATRSLSARPWMLSAGWVLVRALRASPTARWVTGAVALGGAVWWVARAVRRGDEQGVPENAADDETG